MASQMELPQEGDLSLETLMSMCRNVSMGWSVMSVMNLESLAANNVGAMTGFPLRAPPWDKEALSSSDALVTKNSRKANGDFSVQRVIVGVLAKSRDCRLGRDVVFTAIEIFLLWVAHINPIRGAATLPHGSLGNGDFSGAVREWAGHSDEPVEDVAAAAAAASLLLAAKMDNSRWASQDHDVEEMAGLMGVGRARIIEMEWTLLAALDWNISVSPTWNTTKHLLMMTRLHDVIGLSQCARDLTELVYTFPEGIARTFTSALREANVDCRMMRFSEYHAADVRTNDAAAEEDNVQPRYDGRHQRSTMYLDPSSVVSDQLVGATIFLAALSLYRDSDGGLHTNESLQPVLRLVRRVWGTEFHVACKILAATLIDICRCCTV